MSKYNFNSDDEDLDALISAMVADDERATTPDLISDEQQPGPSTSTSNSTTTIEETPRKYTTAPKRSAPPTERSPVRRSDAGVGRTLSLYETMLRRQVFHLGQAQNLQANFAAEETPQHFKVNVQPRLSDIHDNEKAKTAWYAVLHKTSRTLMKIATQHHFHMADESGRKAGAVRCLLLKHPDITPAELAAAKERSRRQPTRNETPPTKPDDRRRHQSYPSRGHKRARRE